MENKENVNTACAAGFAVMVAGIMTMCGASTGLTLVVSGFCFAVAASTEG
jgi:hypothetical protein